MPHRASPLHQNPATAVSLLYYCSTQFLTPALGIYRRRNDLRAQQEPGVNVVAPAAWGRLLGLNYTPPLGLDVKRHG